MFWCPSEEPTNGYYGQSRVWQGFVGYMIMNNWWHDWGASVGVPGRFCGPKLEYAASDRALLHDRVISSGGWNDGSKNRSAHEGGGNVTFGDAHVEWVDFDDFTRTLTASQVNQIVVFQLYPDWVKDYDL